MGILAWREVGHLNLDATRAALRTLPLTDLLGLQVAGLAAVLAMTLYDWRLARFMAVGLPLRRLLRYAWIANTFNNLVGLSGLAGSGIRFLLLTRAGVKAHQGAAYSAIIMLTVPVGLAVLSLVLLFAGPAPPGWTGTLALAGFAAYLPAYVLLMRVEGLRRRLFARTRRLRRFELIQLVVISLADWVLAAAVSWLCLRAAGAPVPAADFVAKFILAAVLGVFSLIPGGLGVFDGSLLIMLSTPGGYSAEQVLAGLLLYRLVYFVMPWLFGVYLGAELLVAREQKRRSRLLHYWRESRLLALVRLPLNLLSSLGVRILGYLTLGAGLALLISAAFPALANRFALLPFDLPFPAIEASHLLSVGVGVLLIALSRGIAEQVDSAYRLTIVLLVSGAILSILKGVNIEQAAALLAIAGVIRLQRRHFYRSGFPFFSHRNLILIGTLAIAVFGYALFGNWVHGTAAIHWSSLFEFAPGLTAPRFARSLLFAMLVILTYLAWSLFRSAKPHLTLPASEELDEARSLLDKYGGSSFAHMLFLGDKYLFWSQDRRALIQFGKIRDRLIALGDPCGDPTAFEAVITEFRAFADLHNLVPLFYETAEAQMHRYYDAGFSLLKLGEMAHVRVSEFTLKGKKRESLRHSVTRAKREGATVDILEHAINPDTWNALRRVSDTWLLDRGVAEKGFSLGYFDEQYLSRAPIAALRVAGRIEAFASLIPDYGTRNELGVDLMRHAPGAPPGTMDLLFVEIIEYARAHGYQYLNLGMAPLAGVGEGRYARSREKLLRLAYQYGNHFYNYKGLRSFKEKFHPEWRSSYLAYPPFTPVATLLMDTAALVAGGYRRIFFKSE